MNDYKVIGYNKEEGYSIILYEGNDEEEFYKAKKEAYKQGYQVETFNINELL